MTRSRGEGRTTISRERVATRSQAAPKARRGDDSRGRSRGTIVDRSRTRTTTATRERSRSTGIERDRDRTLAYRGRSHYSREDDRKLREEHHSYSGGGGRRYARQPYYANGRISRLARYGGGYRVWVGGAPYPFYVPLDYYHRSRFRVGLFINLGGYYNPAGYYDYYDGYNRGYSRGELRGYVESVDYRRDTFVIRNEATGSFVTVVMRDRHRDVRPGDFVELYGDWSRSGVFTAYDVERIN